MLYLPYWMAYEKHELVNALGFEEALKKTNKLADISSEYEFRRGFQMSGKTLHLIFKDYVCLFVFSMPLQTEVHFISPCIL